MPAGKTKQRSRFGGQDAWDGFESDEETSGGGGGGGRQEAFSTAIYSGKKRSASAVDRGLISSSSSSSSWSSSERARQRGPAGAEQAHQAELKRRRAKYARDGDGSHSGLVAADAAQAKAKKKKRSRAGVARREKREQRAREKMLPKSRDPKLQAELRQQESQYDEAEQSAARAEVLHAEEVGVLEAEGEMEATYRFKQTEIKAAVDMLTARKIFDLSLPEYGPYCGVDYTKNGRHLLIGGARGHLAMIDAMTNALQTELHVRETVRDVAFLHDHTMFAVAQRKYCYIYDNKGVELHCLRHHIEPTRVEFLPFHFLMVTAGKTGYLKWQDTSTGQLVAEARTRLGACNVLRQNPYNAVVSAGHSNGTVTMWSPTMSTPLIKMLCHRGPVLAVAHDT